MDKQRMKENMPVKRWEMGKVEPLNKCFFNLELFLFEMFAKQK